MTNIEEINVFAAEIAVEIVKDAGLQDTSLEMTP